MSHFIELERLENIIKKFGDLCRVEKLAEVPVKNQLFPVYGLVLGSKNRQLPTLGLFGGVHGLERIGTHLALAYLETFCEVLSWDQDAKEKLKTSRIVCMPLVNPGGMFMGTRCNPNGVDLNRNAPIEATVKPALILGGHRISKRLPWYRGEVGAQMEVEAQALCDFVRREIFPSKTSLVLDLHSGFGSQDQLWYPYAKTTDPFPLLKSVEGFSELLHRTYPNHVYKVEPQSLNYTTHGDLWDYLFDEHLEKHAPDGSVFMPWTLEMGSWVWVRKNPTQLFSALGPFNPVKEHRVRRTMRRHIPLIDFFLRAVRNPTAWVRP